MQTEERLSLIEESEHLMTEACDRLRMAATGTPYEQSVEHVIRCITDIASGEAGAPSNLRMNILADSEDPVWTRPLVSVKDRDRKDI